MKKQKDNKIEIKTGTTSEFFARGNKLAEHLDNKKKLSQGIKTISFENPKDLVNFISDNKIKLMMVVRKNPQSVTELARILNRERSALYRDIQVLEKYGLVTTQIEKNPGHGRKRMVLPTSDGPIKITAFF